MKALAKQKKEKGIWLTEADKPKVGPREVLIKIKKTAVCGTDLHIYHWDEWAQKTVPVPMITGHEFYGVVEAVGGEVHNFKKGDRVSGEGHYICGECRNCCGDRKYLCRNTKGVGYDIPGVFSEYFAMRAENVFKLPDNISDDIASILDPYGNAVHATLEFNLVGEDVLITGAGPVGCMSAAIAKHVGARFVVVTDVNPYRLALAKKMGATVTVDPTKTDLKDVMKKLGMTEGFDVGIEMSGNQSAFQDMLHALNYGAKVSMLGIPSKPFAIDWSELVFKSIRIVGIYGRRIFETWYKGVAMLQSGLDISPIVTHHFKLNDFEKAFETMASGQSGKVIIDW